LIYGCGSLDGENTIAGNIEVETLAQGGKSWDGSALPKYPQENPQITILRIKIPPSAKLPLHKHPIINAGFMLKGELTVVTDDEKVLKLKAGDPIIEVVDKWHYGRNDGDEIAEIVVFYAGFKGEPLSIKSEK